MKLHGLTPVVSSPRASAERNPPKADKHMKRLFFFVFLVLVAMKSMFVHTAQAHGTAQKVEVPVGQYIAILEYDPAEAIAGELLPISFELQAQGTKADTPFSSVAARIEKDQSTLLLANIGKGLGGYTFSYTFPKSGSYVIHAQYQNEKGDTLAEASFTLTIEESETGKNKMPFAQGIIGGVVGLVGGYLIARLLHKSS